MSLEAGLLVPWFPNGCWTGWVWIMGWIKSIVCNSIECCPMRLCANRPAQTVVFDKTTCRNAPVGKCNGTYVKVLFPDFPSVSNTWHHHMGWRWFFLCRFYLLVPLSPAFLVIVLKWEASFESLSDRCASLRELLRLLLPCPPPKLTMDCAPPFSLDCPMRLVCNNISY